MKYLPGLFILFFFSIASQTAQARGYAIEMIVFEQAAGNTNAAEDEKWDFSDRKITGKQQRMVTLESRAHDFQGKTTLGRLEQTRRRLRQKGHRILKTASWIQPSAVYQHAPLIALGLVDTPLPYGFIRVYKTSLIYADIDLQFSPTPVHNILPPLSSGAATSATTRSQIETLSPAPPDLPEHYFLSEKRRMKFGEIHYFDHPKFAVVLGIWPVSDH